MKWYVKAAIQKFVAVLPASHKINRWMQGLNGNQALDEKRCARKWTQVSKMLAILQSHDIDVRQMRALEIGAGRHLVSAFALRNAGIKEVVTYDLQFLTNYSMCIEVIQALQRLDERGRITIVPEFRELMASTVESARGAAGTREDTVALLSSFGIRYRVGDMLKEADVTYDLFFSVSTLEHIPQKDLEELFRYYFTVSTATSCMAHAIDMKDHFSQDDRSITKYNFLKFSDRTWRLINSSLNYQNRLRASEYIRLAADAGWTYLGGEERRKDADTLSQVRLAPRFQEHFDTADLEINAINAVWRR